MPLDYELKIGRARKHLDDLNAEIAGWLDGYLCSLRQEYDPDARFPDAFARGQRGRLYMLAGSVTLPGFPAITGNPEWGHGLITIYIDQVPCKEVSDSFGLLIGDFLHSLRSGLDNLAYSLTLAGSGPVTEEMKRDSEFPVIGDEDRRGQPGQGPRLFAGAERKYAGWQPEAKAAAEALQPYQRGRSFRTHPLWLLHDLDRIDKHRFLHTVAAYSIAAGWRPTECVNLQAFGPGFIEVFSGPVESGAPVARIGGVHLAEPGRDMHVEINPAVNVVFSPETPSVGEQPVMESVAAIFNYVVMDVIPKLAAFL
jgi:hypothetical protein